MPATADYRKLCERYFANADKALTAKELDKAGEFLWGCYATALKALAAKKGLRIRTHSLLRRFANQLTKETGDTSYQDTMALAEGLHANYYEAELTEADVLASRERVQKTAGKILALL